MDSNRSQCARRVVVPIGVGTPLLVPSFSSRGYPGVAALFDTMQGHLHEATLLSAYDLHFNSLPWSAVEATEVVVIDSGGYEARASVDLNEPYLDDRRALPWDQAAYARVLDTLPRSALFLVVSFDSAGSLAEQVGSAQQDFAGRAHAKDFLYKPLAVGQHWLDIDAILNAPHLLAEFSVLGVTEKELGPSPMERCRALVRLRSGLAAAGLDLPIHVFGCLTPLSIIAYFLCGADIFDGLAWLRFAFDSLPVHGAELAIAEGDSRTCDDERQARQCVANLGVLRQLQRRLQQYVETRDPGTLATVPRVVTHIRRVLELVRAAGGWAPEADYGW